MSARKPIGDTPTTINRRELLAAGGGLLIAFTIGVPMLSRKALASSTNETTLNAYLRISNDGVATIYASHPEIGQGVKTALPMILAEELDMPWERVKVEQAPVDGDVFGRQFAGGSMSVRTTWEPLRKAGATARAMLISAAANEWSVAPERCRTENGAVINIETGKRLDYGTLAENAAKLPLPDSKQIKLKNRADFRLLGTRVTGVDNHALVTGAPLFGIDQSLPGMRYATYTRCPAVGGTVRSANLDRIKDLAGVDDAFILEEREGPSALRAGVAIVARSTWAAIAAKRQLEIDWDESKASTSDWSALREQALALANKSNSGDPLHNDGDVDKAFASAAKTLSGTYVYPFLPHAPLEPQNCTAWVKGDSAEIWAPSQTPASGGKLAADICGLDAAKVTVHQTRIGGAFGRRLLNDYVAEAAAISQRAGVPIKLQWTREDDFGNDFYRPGGVHGYTAAIDENGKLTAWRNHFVTFSNDGKSAARSAALGEGSFPQYLVENYLVNQSLLPLQLPTGAWRAPSSNAFGFVTNSFLHEISTAAQRDHLEFLLDLMGEPRDLPGSRGPGMNTGRARDVIAEVGRRANWGHKMPANRGLGLAFYYSHSGYFAEIADVEVTASQQVTVHKIFVVGDVGPIVNLSMAEHQCIGAATDGLSTMLGLQVSFSKGRINEQNFDHYPMLRMPNAPEVDVHFLQSDNPPTGLGEPALPPIAGAVCNAIFAASGTRVRELPISKSGFTV